MGVGMDGEGETTADPFLWYSEASMMRKANTSRPRRHGPTLWPRGPGFITRSPVSPLPGLCGPEMLSGLRMPQCCPFGCPLSPGLNKGPAACLPLLSLRIAPQPHAWTGD